MDAAVRIYDELQKVYHLVLIQFPIMIIVKMSKNLFHFLVILISDVTSQPAEESFACHCVLAVAADVPIQLSSAISQTSELLSVILIPSYVFCDSAAYSPVPFLDIEANHLL